MKFYNTIPEEQESHIVIDYFNRTLTVYSSRKSVLKRLLNKLGKPIKEHFINKALTGASWRISFDNKKDITAALSKTLLIGQMKNV